MYRFAGYLIKNQAGDIIQFASTRAQGEQFCQQNGLPVSHMTQAYEFRTPEYVEPIDGESTDELTT